MCKLTYLLVGHYRGNLFIARCPQRGFVRWPSWCYSLPSDLTFHRLPLLGYPARCTHRRRFSPVGRDGRTAAAYHRTYPTGIRRHGRLLKAFKLGRGFAALTRTDNLVPWCYSLGLGMGRFWWLPGLPAICHRNSCYGCCVADTPPVC